MRYAGTVGLYHVARAIRRYGAPQNGDAWAVAESLGELAARGRGFNG